MFLNASSPYLSYPAPSYRVGDQGLECVGKCLRVPWRNQHAPLNVGDDLQIAAHTGGNDKPKDPVNRNGIMIVRF